MRAIDAIVIHCSASLNGDTRITRDVIDRWHREKNWSGVGYHYVIHADGELVEGRPLEKAGAHVAGSNAKSIGICMVGTDRFSEAQWVTLRDLVATLQMRFPAAKVLGHRDYSPDKDGDGVIEPWEWLKTCPGFSVDEWRLAGMDPRWNSAHLLEAV